MSGENFWLHCIMCRLLTFWHAKSMLAQHEHHGYIRNKIISLAFVQLALLQHISTCTNVIFHLQYD